MFSQLVHTRQVSLVLCLVLYLSVYIYVCIYVCVYLALSFPLPTRRRGSVCVLVCLQTPWPMFPRENPRASFARNCRSPWISDPSTLKPNELVKPACIRYASALLRCSPVFFVNCTRCTILHGWENSFLWLQRILEYLLEFSGSRCCSRLIIFDFTRVQRKERNEISLSTLRGKLTIVDERTSIRLAKKWLRFFHEVCRECQIVLGTLSFFVEEDKNF